MTDVLSADWVLPIEGPPIRGGAVMLQGGRIVAVGAAEELGTGRRFDGAAILPGFVNAHTHLEYAVYAGFGDGLDFDPWLGLHIERKGRLASGDAVAIARLGAAECLAAGVTTIGDASFTGAAARAAAELGLRAIVYLEVFGDDPRAAMERFAALRDELSGYLSDRVGLGVSPHAPYSTSLEVYEACGRLGLPVATHISESRAENEWLLYGRGPMASIARLLVAPPGTSGTRLLDSAGLLGPQLLAAHCVDLDGGEIDLLARTGTGVAHCPRSNGFLGCGIAPLVAMHAAGVRLGLGTDSPASTPSFDIFEELRAAVLCARARERRADALTAERALDLATLGSARALGLDAEVGSLAPGKRADLTVVSLEGSPYHPWENPAAAVVFGGTRERVITTLVDGEARYERGGFEWHELRRNAESARSRMLAAPASAGAAAGT
ncbi:MAG: amidohydrolase family protein [Gaiellaceae bacterium]